MRRSAAAVLLAATRSEACVVACAHMPAPVISVVALTWNSQRFVDSFLGSLLADIDASAIDAEVIVVDNGSSDGTLAALARYQHRREVSVIRLRRNFGTTVSRNLGLRRARGQFMLVIDSDTRIPRGSLLGLLTAFTEIAEQEPVGLLAPRLTYPDGEFQESARRFPTVFTKVYRLLGWDELRRRDESDINIEMRRQVPIDYAISAAWFLPRSTLERAGYLDEHIFYAPEDVEFCARVWSRGLSVWYCPRVTIVHDCQRLTHRKPISSLGLSHLQGLVRYWSQYRGFFSRPPGQMTRAVGLAAAAGDMNASGC
jgi:GT2 family glycosyltransferase